MTNNEKHELLELIHTLRDGELNAPQRRRLEEIVAGDPEAMRLFAKHRLLEARLEMELASFRRTEEESNESSQLDYVTPATKRDVEKIGIKRRTVRFASLAVIAMTLCLTVAIGVWPEDDAANIDGPIVVELSEDVEILGSDGESLELATGDVLLNGHTVSTKGDDSFAIVRYPDLTTVVLNSRSTAQFSVTENGRKRVYLANGVATADVAPQPDDLPMIIATPHANVRVLGTKLISHATETGTRVELEKGEVELIRKADGQSVRIKEGLFAEATSEIEPLTAQPLSLIVSEPQLTIERRAMSMLALRETNQLVTSAHQEAARVFVFNTQTGKQEGHFKSAVNRVRTLSASRDGSLLAIAGRDNHVSVVDLSSRDVVHNFPSADDGVRAIAISADGSRVAYSEVDVRHEEALVWIHDVVTGDRTHTLTAEGQEIVSVDFSPDGRLLAGGSHDGKVVLWDVETGDPHTLWPGQRRIHTVKFSPHGNLLACCDHRGAIRVWDVSTRLLRHTFEDVDRGVRTLAFSPNGKLLVSGDVDGRVRARRISDGLELFVLRVHEHHSIMALDFLDDYRLATSCHGTIAFWDIAQFTATPEPQGDVE